MLRIVVTGGEGFVGKYLVDELGESDYEIRSWDLPEVDITKRESYQERVREFDPEWVVHLAALAAASQSFGQDSEFRRVNVEGTRKLLEAVPKAKFLIVSSGDIYGKQSQQPVSELDLDECRPGNPYAISKLEMETMIEREYAERVIRVRPFPHMGAGQKPGFVTADFAGQIAELEKSGGGVIKVGNLEAKRDFLHVKDVVRAYKLLLEKGQLGGVYNIASGEAVSIQSVLDKLLALSPAEISVEQDPKRMRPSDVAELTGDASKLREATGWKPEIDLDQALDNVLSDWRQRVGS